MTTPNRHYTRARRVNRGRLSGVYVTHGARRLRRRERRRTITRHTVTVGKDVLWGGVFFVGMWMTILVVVIGGLVLFG